MRERTFALIKSGAFNRHQAVHILHAIYESGLNVRRLATLHAGMDTRPNVFDRLYHDHQGKPFYDGLIQSVSDGVVLMLIEGDDAVARWRRLMGPTDPAKARGTEPNSLRAKFGIRLPDNAVHGSDSSDAAEREIGLFFGFV